jgi:hypothetical protein
MAKQVCYTSPPSKGRMSMPDYEISYTTRRTIVSTLRTVSETKFLTMPRLIKHVQVKLSLIYSILMNMLSNEGADIRFGWMTAAIFPERSIGETFQKVMVIYVLF